MRASEKNLRLFFPGCTRAVDVRAVMIDLDGTMVNTLGDFDLALNGMLAEQQWPRVECSFIERMIGKGSPHLVRQTLLHLGLGRDGAVDGALYERAHTCYQQHYNRINGRASHLYPGVKEGVEQLHAAGLRLACITNKPTRYARELLDLKGLLQHFEVVNGGDAFPRKKPDPMPLVETCKQIGLPTAVVLMIGDSQNDALAARAAGCPVALVTYGYNHGEPVRAVDADGFVDRIDQIDLSALA